MEWREPAETTTSRQQGEIQPAAAGLKYRDIKVLVPDGALLKGSLSSRFRFTEASV